MICTSLHLASLAIEYPKTYLSPCASAPIAKMSMFRAKKLDIGCFINIKVIRDHTKRKVFAEHEAERYGQFQFKHLGGPWRHGCREAGLEAG